FIPGVSLTNSGKTIITGIDLYGNSANKIDYGISIIDYITFGIGFSNVKKSISVINNGINILSTSYSSIRTFLNGKDKQK
ncbi:MAG: hypothetical protein J6Z12_05555, partial [Paludibacteraceae bacterium]|nr:hypothetical protein [Paludibacteraceae bacterium]